MVFMDDAVRLKDSVEYGLVVEEESKEKYHLVEYDDLPNYLKHNEFVVGYYRSEWPWKQTILSIFSIHNETINVWTHLIGFFVFLALTFGSSMVIPCHVQQVVVAEATLSSLPDKYHYEMNVSSLNASFYLPQSIWTFLPENIYSPSNSTTAHILDEEEVNEISRWPFFAFLFGVMLCLLSSSACHLLSCHSEHSSYVMLRLDYAGITTLIVTSFYPPVYYSFLCDPFSRNLYIGFITIFGIATVLVSLVPVFETPEFRFARSGLFVCMGLSGLVPIAHNLILHSHRPEVLVTAACEMMMGCFYVLGVVVYVARVPERWFPGKFDLAGHSHQLFHVLVVAGAYTHYLAVLVYLQWRDVDGC